MLSLASCTFGWSNGLMPSTQPATAVANSAKKKTRPRSDAPCDDQGDRGVSGLGERRHLLVELLVGLVAVAQVGEDAVVAVGIGLAERLVGHRQDALALLAGRLGDQLLDPEAEARDRLGDDEGELVAPLERQLAHRDAQPQPRVGGRRYRSPCSSARPPGAGRAAPRGPRPSAPPARARSTTAPSSARRCSGRSRTPAGSPSPWPGLDQPAAGVGDGHEAAAVSAASARRSSACATASRSCRRTWRRR